MRYKVRHELIGKRSRQKGEEMVRYGRERREV